MIDELQVALDVLQDESQPSEHVLWALIVLETVAVRPLKRGFSPIFLSPNVLGYPETEPRKLRSFSTTATQPLTGSSSGRSMTSLLETEDEQKFWDLYRNLSKSHSFTYSATVSTSSSGSPRDFF